MKQVYLLYKNEGKRALTLLGVFTKKGLNQILADKVNQGELEVNDGTLKDPVSADSFANMDGYDISLVIEHVFVHAVVVDKLL